ncbi:hypothetical protein [Bradyrhizobium sp. 44]|uniref:hypothetical protein n=1 Tax=Bradyrhizobium sp. 44 TaxID=2782675 RepID=UPI001FF9997B|nr:hypothetical protein [Bradyrhizobium sp. 44]
MWRSFSTCSTAAAKRSGSTENFCPTREVTYVRVTDAREAVKALIVANEFLERRLEELASPGYARGRVLPRDRKDWYD